MIQADPEKTSADPQQQVLIYARELNDLHQRHHRQLEELQTLYAALQVKEQHRARLMDELLTAQEHERRRIAHDIHDGPLQDLGVLLLSIERCKRQIDAGLLVEALTGLAALRQEAQQTINTLRGLVNDLRPGVLDTYGLLGALDHLAGRLGRETGVVIEVSSRLGSRLAPNLEVLIFRLTQEALNNIRKHAQAAHAWIVLQRQGADLHIEIRDDGQGFAIAECLDRALATGHLGLASMRERVELAGGQMTITSAPDQGTALSLVLPFQALAGDDDMEAPAPVATPTLAPPKRKPRTRRTPATTLADTP